MGFDIGVYGFWVDIDIWSDLRVCAAGEGPLVVPH